MEKQSGITIGEAINKRVQDNQKGDKQKY